MLCTKCNQEKPETAFYLKSRSDISLGRQPWCVDCYRMEYQLRAKKWKQRQNDNETKVCIDCKEEKPLSEFYVTNSDCRSCDYKKSKIWVTNNRAVARKATKDSEQRLRLKTLEKYGNKCTCCGISTMTFLSIDHINGGGTKHRKALNHGRNKGGWNFYKWLQRNEYPNEYQILCHNCNWGKHVEGTCPHQRAVIDKSELIMPVGGC